MGVFEADRAGVRRVSGPTSALPASQHARDCHGLFPSARTHQSTDGDTTEGFGIAEALSGAASRSIRGGPSPALSSVLLRGGAGWPRKITHGFIRRRRVRGHLAALLKSCHACRSAGAEGRPPHPDRTRPHFIHPSRGFWGSADCGSVNSPDVS